MKNANKILQINDAFQLLRLCTNQTGPENVSIFTENHTANVRSNDINPPAAKDNINDPSKIPVHNCHPYVVDCVPLLFRNDTSTIGGRRSSLFNSILSK